MKHKKIKIIATILLVVLLTISVCCLFGNNESGKLKTIKSAKQLKRIYEGEDISDIEGILINTLAMPFSFLADTWDNQRYYDYITNDSISINQATSADSIISNLESSTKGDTSSSVSSTGNGDSKDYSTTNIQVENVDEADITKTDGDYIYSISEDRVIITDVKDSSSIKIASKISLSKAAIPEDMILYNDKLVVIAVDYYNSSSYYNRFNNTIVSIFDITDRTQPKKVKEYTLYEPYYTSRCIDGKLYVISSGQLRLEDNEVVAYYKEDGKEKDIGFDNIKYLDDIKTKQQTLISMVDLNNAQDVNVNSYLIDISNAYVSENAIYLLNQKYKGYNYGVPPISSLFTLKGAIGPFVYEDNEEQSNNRYETEIYKFEILEDGSIKYSCKNEVEGKTINQYSVDEYNNNLRVALYDYEGSRVVIFDENLKQIGKTEYLAKGENMYSSRFMGNKAYLVTYKTIDPLFVIDLSDPTNPKALGELKIPGYSTYLHPYDENHIIGIGMETKETVRRDSMGKVISTTASVIGMKMALFDVSDVNNPVQISSTVIGDARTTSAILTNPKALLFSKEKELIAIPVNNYAEDFEVSSSENYQAVINNYTNYNKARVSEGYFVYKINVEEGFNLKGVITHDVSIGNKYSYNYTSKLLRGLYIENNLYTVSETAIKINDLETLSLINELKIK